MRNSGHNEKFRVNVLSKAAAKHRAELTKHNNGIDLYRNRKERQEQAKSTGGKSNRENWFKKGQSQVTSVLKVPLTANNALKNKITNVVKNYEAPEGIVTRVQEANGQKLEHLISRTDPFPRNSCNRELCPLTSGEFVCQEQCFQCKLCDLL